MDDESLAAASSEAKPEQSAALELMQAFERWVPLATRHRTDSRAPGVEREVWLATADYLFRMADVMDGSLFPSIGDPIRFAATGIIEALTGHGPKSFNPPRGKGRPRHSRTQHLMRGVAIAYVKLCRQKIIPDGNPVKTVCSTFNVSPSTLEDDWLKNIDPEIGAQRLMTILSRFENPDERLSVAQLYLRVAHRAYLHGI